MSLFEEILSDTVSPDIWVSDILRKASVLSYKLNSPEFKTWVTDELNGYSDVNLLPDYRRLKCACYGDWICGMTKVSNGQIPVHLLPGEISTQVTNVNLIWPIGQVESTVKDPKNDGLHLGLPSEFSAIANHSLGIQLLQAQMYVGKPHVMAIVETVRNRLLAFMLELQNSYPDIAASADAMARVEPREVTKIFMTNIGKIEGSNVAIDHSSVSHSSANVTTLSDLSRSIQDLRLCLDDVTPTERKDIESAIEVLERAVSESNEITKSEIVKAVETASKIPPLKQRLAEIAVNASGGVAATALVEGIKFVIGTATGAS